MKAYVIAYARKVLKTCTVYADSKKEEEKLFYDGERENIVENDLINEEIVEIVEE